jgi:hypothetical protein
MKEGEAFVLVPAQSRERVYQPLESEAVTERRKAATIAKNVARVPASVSTSDFEADAIRALAQKKKEMENGKS